METIITHLVGKEAKQYVTETLDSHTNNSKKYHHPSGLYLKGYYWDEDVWVAFDNTTNDCWVEEFDREKDCIEWLYEFD